MCEEHLAATVSGETDLLHYFGLLSLGYDRAVKVGALTVCVALQLLEALLVVEPLVGEKLTAIHATDWDDHSYYSGS
jgi:hypothetical protein